MKRVKEKREKVGDRHRLREIERGVKDTQGRDIK